MIAPLALCLITTLAHADTGTMTPNVSDAQINSASGVLSISGQTTTYLHVGGGSGVQNNIVYAFQIPSTYLTDPSQEFTAANFTVHLGSFGAMSVNGDLYGVGYSSSPTVLTSDFYEGALDAANPLIADNFLTPSSVAYSAVSTSGGSLVSYLNAVLAAARADGLTTAYVFFRVNPDAYIYGNFYLIAMADVANSNAPSLSYTTAPIPGWTTVPLGGGGYVTGLVSNANGSAIYCRTDVGGAFRWVPATDGVNGSWKSISDAMVPYGTAGASGLVNVEGIGTDPNNLNQVYVGAGSNGSGLRGIWSSADQGASWTQINTTIRMAGNGGPRANGERLAVDPNNSNILWYGSNQDGLQKGVKTGSTWAWTQIPAATLPFGTAGNGVPCVVADKNGTSTILYACVSEASAGGVYKSTDGGGTWIKMSGTSLLSPRRAQVAADGTVYITGGTAGVGKLTRAGVFSMLTVLPTGIAYHAVAVDPNDATGNTVYVAQASSGSGGIWYSNNGGTSFLAQGTTFNEGPVTLFNHGRREPDSTPALTGYWFGSTSSMLITAANSNQLWLGDFFGVSRTSNATAMGTNPGAFWNTLQKGQEETVVLDLKTAPSGLAKLLSGLSDVGGFRYLDITNRPYGTFGNGNGNPGGGNHTSLDFSEANTNVWARAWVSSSGSTGSGAASSDNGATWVRFGEVAASKVTNSATAGWETWDVGVYLARQKAKNPTGSVTFVIATDNTPNYANSVLAFDSREAVDTTLTPRLLVNGSTTLVASADTTVIGSSPTTNYGNATTLSAQYYFGQVANSRHFYVKFNLSTLPAGITSATLQLHRLAAGNTTVFPLGVYVSTNTSWVEGDGGTDNLPAGELTWNSKPAALSNTGLPQEGPIYYDGGTGLAGGRVAVSSTDATRMVWMAINAAPRYSTDRGVTWTAATGAPASQITGIYTNGNSIATSGQPLAADRGNGNFYIGSFGGASHSIYRSTDGGVTYALATTVGNGGSYNMRTPQLVAAPISSTCPTGGDVWLCDDGTYNGGGGGLWRSTNSATSFSAISGVTKVTQVSFGKAASGSGYTVFINGIKGGVQGIYRSDNYGGSWTQLVNPTIEPVSALSGDRQNYGRVFIGTGGRGTFVGQ